MGLFGKKKLCAVCDSKVGITGNEISNNQWICSQCYKKSKFTSLTPLKTLTANDVNEAIRSALSDMEELKSFNVTRRIGHYFEIDDNQKKWLIPDGIAGKKKNPKIYDCDQILEYELIEDGSSVTKGGLGRAVAGGILFGGVGAIVGGVTANKKINEVCNSLKIKITTSDVTTPIVYIHFIVLSTKKNSLTYKNAYTSAKDCLSLLDSICNNTKMAEDVPSTNSISAADEIIKFKSLLDSGVITEEEFQSKKKELLGL